MSSSYLIHDMVRVCPQTGEVLEEQARIRSLAELAEVSSNPVSPRNAYVSFQLIVRLDDAGPSAIRFEADPLRGEQGEIGAGEFVFYAQWYHRVQGRYYPDALVPLDGGDAGPRTLAAISAANDVEGQAYVAVWVDLFVPAGVHAGDYRGAVRVTTGERDRYARDSAARASDGRAGRIAGDRRPEQLRRQPVAPDRQPEA
ncbi:hypothetical protein OMP38_17840 [Cohnella ginsengisoli]|uniref:Uncharacterized protein n=1 Tax=Cohnella ginsengisoli TaxID=425004 RepID=A0A9X4KLC1_9BACL|nr:hypothetical protein [Cohnella ginsengisoli]MDG0792527.1 hypothetical protein [Cohnella ginsengisoli]